MNLRTVCAGLALFLMAAGSAGAADGKKTEPVGEHPSIPATPALGAGLIYEQGAPSENASAGPNAGTRARSIERGRVLYDTHCITCHGADLRGLTGAPALTHDAGASVDFFVRTGRMPATETVVQAIHTAPHFDASEIDALDAYVGSRAQSGIPIPSVAVDPKLLARGREVFEENCQQCHGAAAEGATVGEGWLAPPLYSASSLEIGEAVRIGPGEMPRFSEHQISASDVDAVATYVSYLTIDSPSYGGLTMDYLGPAAEGLVGGILGVGALFWVIFFTGTKADGMRLHER